MEDLLQYLPEVVEQINIIRSALLKKHNPIRESGETGLWSLRDEDGSFAHTTISKDDIRYMTDPKAPIKIVWATEENLEKRKKEIKASEHFPTYIVTHGSLHRIDKDLGDDKESSHVEEKKVLIYRVNLEFRRNDLLEDYSKGTHEQSDIAVNDD